MEPRMTVLTLGVRDLERSRAFYVDGLGWEPVLDVPGEVVFIQVAGGLVLALWGVDELAAEAGDVDHHGPPEGKAPPIALAQNVGSAEEVAEVINQAVAAGATLITPARPTDWGGTNGYFADPDGYRWEIAHNSGLQIDPDGTVHMGPAA